MRFIWSPPRAHAAELGNVVPEEPLLFLKPTSSYITQGESIVVSSLLPPPPPPSTPHITHISLRSLQGVQSCTMK